MTIGIYKLGFIGTSKVYIGQSSNIEKRFNEHCNSLAKGTAKAKLQGAYTLYGKPYLEVIITTTSIEDLDKLEVEAIDIYDSVENGFNTLASPGNPNMRGLDSVHCKFNKEQYTEAYKLLAHTNLTIKNIAEKTGLTNTVVQTLGKGNTHVWLSLELPEEAQILIEKNKYGRYKTDLTANTRTIVSPEGAVYCVENIREFARKHGLCSAHLSSLLNGKRKTHKGWKKQPAEELASLEALEAIGAHFN
jgi:group I intron endonuclease